MIELLWGEKMTETKKITIAITATFTAELIEEPLAYWMKELEIQSRIEFSPYSQVFQQLLDPLSLFSKNDKGINNWVINTIFCRIKSNSPALMG